ncbi:hypothetical protein PENSPDRAFT_250357 [Peniophora sp. CONT]|nr:hypothetical protein PENSPDRAFT_250357 [Peniophora sp. CONT]
MRPAQEVLVMPNTTRISRTRTAGHTTSNLMLLSDAGSLPWWDELLKGEGQRGVGAHKATNDAYELLMDFRTLARLSSACVPLVHHEPLDTLRIRCSHLQFDLCPSSLSYARPVSILSSNFHFKYDPHMLPRWNMQGAKAYPMTAYLAKRASGDSHPCNSSTHAKIIVSDEIAVLSIKCPYSSDSSSP